MYLHFSSFYFQSQAKCEILLCFQKMLFGLGNAASSGYKDIYKACKACLVDKSMSVRWAAAKVSYESSEVSGLNSVVHNHFFDFTFFSL